jgi:hypothetical protein
MRPTWRRAFYRLISSLDDFQLMTVSMSAIMLYLHTVSFVKLICLVFIKNHGIVFFAMPHNAVDAVYGFQEYSFCVFFVRDCNDIKEFDEAFTSSMIEYKRPGDKNYLTAEFVRKVHRSEHRPALKYTAGSIHIFTHGAYHDDWNFIYNTKGDFSTKLRITSEGGKDRAIPIVLKTTVPDSKIDLPRIKLLRLYSIFADHKHDPELESVGEQIVFLKDTLKEISHPSLVERTKYTLFVKELAFKRETIDDYETYKRRFQKVFFDENILKIELLHAAVQSKNVKLFDSVPVDHCLKCYRLYQEAIYERKKMQ